MEHAQKHASDCRRSRQAYCRIDRKIKSLEQWLTSNGNYLLRQTPNTLIQSIRLSARFGGISAFHCISVSFNAVRRCDARLFRATHPFISVAIVSRTMRPWCNLIFIYSFAIFFFIFLSRETCALLYANVKWDELHNIRKCIKHWIGACAILWHERRTQDTALLCLSLILPPSVSVCLSPYLSTGFGECSMYKYTYQWQDVILSVSRV